jgi:hypothetical protein
MTSVPDTTVAITRSGDASDAQTVAIQVWRNTGLYVSSNTSINTSTVLVNPPAITTTTANNVLLVIGAGGFDNASVQTYTASYLSNFLTIGSNDSYDSTIGFGSITQPIAGTYDPAAFTFSGPNSINFSHAAVTIALKPSITINTITYGNNTFVYATDNGIIATSSNGVTWTKQTSGTDSGINAVVYANNTFVYAGRGGVLATSPNAATWTARTSGTVSNINALIYANNTFVYAADEGALATSPDAITWTTRTSGTSNNINELSYVNGIFVYGGSGGVLATSPDAITWTQRTSSTPNNIISVIENNNSVLFGGDLGTLGNYELYSYDYNTEFVLPSSNSYFDIYIKS